MPFFYRTPDLVAYARNERPLTIKTDVFQLGLVLSELFTGRNPARRPADNDMLSPVQLDALEDVPGQFAKSILTLLKRMLIMDQDQREPASRLMDGWLGLFEQVCKDTNDLEGHVF